MGEGSDVTSISTNAGSVHSLIEVTHQRIYADAATSFGSITTVRSPLPASPLLTSAKR